MAETNAKNFVVNAPVGEERIASHNTAFKGGSQFNKLKHIYELAMKQNPSVERRYESPRSNVKSRLGYNYKNKFPYYKDDRFKPTEWRDSRERSKPDYSQMTCDYCGVKGHIKRKCFRLKNSQRNMVKFVDEYEQAGPSQVSNLNKIFSRMRADDSESDEEDRDTGCNWKSNNNGSPNAAKSSRQK
ncbi:uncharacterized protein LOC131428088 [Malaya genurostris]|uniref:uncharacterized protein LOC131428088 n=1 Tax=Malaya genurostris TaxID=325434 RepID=UPI0026F402CF|nr:uncharacterized protein LOC131428088 [Malaya genurostris]